MKNEYIRGLVCLLFAGIVCVVCTSCGSPDGYDSDLPWNTPQSWEGSPMMPGMNGQ